MSPTIPNPASPSTVRLPINGPHHWGQLLRIIFGDPDVHPHYAQSYTPSVAVRTLRIWQGTDLFNRWAQSLPPEDAAKLFAILSAPEVPTDTSSGSGSP